MDGSTDDARRRSADLVDVCWDHDTRLVVTSRHPADRPVRGAVTDVQRPLSRLAVLRTP